ncbi:hypothetical protein CDAR_591671 [Caerostris darwini]|uniref:Uncharacterized protein n=1 Tax=Caerostris darwini TaxID=1538125 RepID=A0AAV4PKT3_9ARAC|nr:hypothetical protein CDAR_591671 [Caerostris darwini]
MHSASHFWDGFSPNTHFRSIENGIQFGVVGRWRVRTLSETFVLRVLADCYSISFSQLLDPNIYPDGAGLSMPGQRRPLVSDEQRQQVRCHQLFGECERDLPSGMGI